MILSETLLWDVFFGSWWLLVNLGIVMLAWRCGRVLFPRDRWDTRLLHAAVLYLANVIGLTTLLGSIGWLSGTNLLLLASIEIVIGVFWIRRRLGDCEVSEGGDGHLGQRSGLPSQTGSSQDARVERFSIRPRWEWLWVVAGCLLLSHVVFHGLLKFPREFDSLAYHMPLIDHWLQSGNLYVPWSSTWFLSANSELVGLWMVAPFSGDFLISLNNVPIVFLWAVATFQLLRLAGLSGAWCHIATLGTLSVHSLGHQVTDASNDLAVAAFFLAGCCYTLRYFQAEESRWNAPFLGICIGLVAGVKYFALGYAAVLLGVFCGGVWVRRRLQAHRDRRSRAPSLIRSMVWIIGLASLFGGYWYLRNWVYGGSPLFPMGVASDVGSLGYPNLWQTTFAGNRDPIVLDLALEAVWRMTGSWHFAAFISTPAMLVCFLILALGRGLDPVSRVVHFSLFLWLIGSAAVLVVTPFALEDQPGTLNHLRWAYTPARYGLCYLSIASIGLAVAMHRIAESFSPIAAPSVELEPSHSERTTSLASHAAGRLGMFVMVGLVLWQLLHRLYAGHREFEQVNTALLGLNLALVSVLGVMLLFSDKTLLRSLVMSGCVIGFAMGIGFLSQRWHHGLGAHFDRIFRSDVFATFHDPESRERVLVLDTRPYPFFGSYRQNQVINPRQLTQRDALRTLVDDNHINWVVLQEENNRPIYFYRGMMDAIRQAEDRFEPVSERGLWRCFRVIGTSGADTSEPLISINALGSYPKAEENRG